eukprot:scaffold298695_cov17-Tisochrysis_lutea.AAC.1
MGAKGLRQALNGSTVLRAGPGEAVVPSEPSSQPAQPAQAPPPLFVLAHPAQPQVRVDVHSLNADAGLVDLWGWMYVCFDAGCASAPCAAT